MSAMAEETDKSPEEKSNAEKMLDQSTAIASERVKRNLLIEKQNKEMKRLFRLLPFQIFLLVAEADGKTDAKEVAQFREFINHRATHCSNPYTRRMLHSTVVNYTVLTNRFLSGQLKKDFKIVEKAMTYMRVCVTKTVLTDICKDLRELAVAIAEASGGFLGVTSPISKEEEAVLEKLNATFNQAIEKAVGSADLTRLQFDI